MTAKCPAPNRLKQFGAASRALDKATLLACEGRFPTLSDLMSAGARRLEQGISKISPRRSGTDLLVNGLARKLLSN